MIHEETKEHPRKRVLIIDHYDSFTHNVRQLFAQHADEVTVLRPDQINDQSLANKPYSHYVFSPGPGHPKNWKESQEILGSLLGTAPILGICLGHQLIAHHFGFEVIKAPMPIHGHSHPIEHDNSTLFHHISSPFQAARYHSLVASEKLSESFHITATFESLVMGITHRTVPHLYGIQFHPESFLCPKGACMIQNFLQQQIGK